MYLWKLRHPTDHTTRRRTQEYQDQHESQPLRHDHVDRVYKSRETRNSPEHHRDGDDGRARTTEKSSNSGEKSL